MQAFVKGISPKQKEKRNDRKPFVDPPSVVKVISDFPSENSLIRTGFTVSFEVMKKLILSFLILTGLTISSGCQSSKSKMNELAAAKDSPKIEFTLKDNKLPQGLKSLNGQKVTALFIYNLPDSYLIKAKALFNPPDYAAQEVTNLQTDRQGWMDEMIVTYCDECKDIKVQIPFKIMPENLLLAWMDKASLKQEPAAKDIEGLVKYFPDTDVFWIILGSEDYEQRRGETGDALNISAIAENTVTLRSYIFDLKKKLFVNRTQVNATDKDLLIYEKQTPETRSKAKILFDKIKDKFWPLPVGQSYDSPKYDDIYPYPTVPESSFIVKKALSAIGENLNP